MAPVANARRRPPPLEFYRSIRRIAARFEPTIERAMMRALDRLRARIDAGLLRDAIASGDPVSIRKAIFADEFGLLLTQTGVEGGLVAATQAAGRGAAELVSRATGLEFAFRDVDPAAVLFARTRVAELVVAVTEDVKEGIRIVTALGERIGLTVDQQARAIRELVGLPPPWVEAPTRLGQEIRDGRPNLDRRLSAVDKQRIRKRVREGTADEAFIAEIEERYAHSLRTLRARTIARTETARASSFGQRTAWRQAQEENVLPRTARRVWIVTPDDRLRYTHAQVPGMNPEGVEIDGGVYDTPLGPSSGPPLEPNCRCSEGLIFPTLDSGPAAPPEPEPDPPPAPPRRRAPRAPRVPRAARPRRQPPPEPRPTPPTPAAEATVPAKGSRKLEEVASRVGRMTKEQRESIEKGLAAVLGDFPAIRLDRLELDARLKRANAYLQSRIGPTGEILESRMKFNRTYAETAARMADRDRRAFEVARQRGHYPGATRWSVSTTAEDRLLATAAHEAAHALHFNAFGNYRVARLAWSNTTRKHGVTKADRLAVSAYADSKDVELWAEAIAALAIGEGGTLPASIRAAVDDFLEQIRRAIAAGKAYKAPPSVSSIGTPRR